MTEVFKAKIRKIGNSLGVIIPADILNKLGYRKDEVLEIAIPPKNEEKNRILLDIAGIDAGKPSFKREREDRY